MQQINPSNSNISFESVCRYILQKNGYEIIRNNLYDKEGGDADIVCKKTESTISPFESSDIRLLVQVKKYSGQTGDHAVKQLIKLIKSDPINNQGCVISLGDSFTIEARDMAMDNNIALIDGKTTCQMLIQSMLDNGDE